MLKEDLMETNQTNPDEESVNTQLDLGEMHRQNSAKHILSLPQEGMNKQFVQLLFGQERVTEQVLHTLNTLVNQLKEKGKDMKTKVVSSDTVESTEKEVVTETKVESTQIKKEGGSKVGKIIKVCGTVVGVAALGTGIHAVIKHRGVIKEAWDNGGLKAAVKIIWAGFKSSAGALWNWLKTSAVPKVVATVTAAVNGIISIFKNLFRKKTEPAVA